MRWTSHNDRAAEALKKLAGPHVPASVKQLERAITRAHSTYEKAERAARSSGATLTRPDDSEPQSDAGIDVEATEQDVTSTQGDEPIAAA